MDFRNYYENIPVGPESTEPVHYSPENGGATPPTEKESIKTGKGSAPGRAFIVSVACVGVLLSGVAGFSGGYLAANSQSVPSGTSSSANGGIAANAASAGSSTTTATTMSISDIANSVSDSVVEISTEQNGVNFMMQSVTSEAAGSGVIVSSDGYIVTNNHVIEGANSISVRLKNGESYPAKLIGTDERTDIAVIKVEATGLKAAVMGSSESLMVGDNAIAIGNPLGKLGGTVTNGIISALDREITLGTDTMNLLQTNAAINPGNSGGGLFNDRGELIGIVVAKSAGSGIEGLGFAIPIDDARDVINDLMTTGYVTGRGELGISVIDIQDPQTAFMYRVSQSGTYVMGVNKDSPAALAGMKVGDGIVEINGEKITSSTELKSALGEYKAGESITVTVLRDGQTVPLNVTLGEYVPEDIKSKSEAA